MAQIPVGLIGRDVVGGELVDLVVSFAEGVENGLGADPTVLEGLNGELMPFLEVRGRLLNFIPEER